MLTSVFTMFLAILCAALFLLEYRKRLKAEAMADYYLDRLSQVFQEKISAHMVGGPLDGKTMITCNCKHIKVPVLRGNLMFNVFVGPMAFDDAEYDRESVRFVYRDPSSAREPAPAT